jgi:hypothetical protein
MLNSAMILPLLLVMGGMSTWAAAASEVHVDVESPAEEDAFDQDYRQQPRLDVLHYGTGQTSVYRKRELSSGSKGGYIDVTRSPRSEAQGQDEPVSSRRDTYRRGSR